MKTLHDLTTNTILLLLLFFPGAQGAKSQRGDLTNPDAQHIQLVESDRIVGKEYILILISPCRLLL
jgi:hypothetical protein